VNFLILYKLAYLSQYNEEAMGWMTGVQFLAGTFPLHHHILLGSRVHPASYSVVTGACFLRSITAGALN
jgi:hypothetical protein